MGEERAVELVQGRLSYEVVGCAQRVHAALGPGLPEAVYQHALCHELAKAHIPFQAQARFEVVYDGAVCGEFRADVYVSEKIILELKAVEAVCQQHEAQTLACLKASNARVGILINFGEVGLKTKRFVM